MKKHILGLTIFSFIFASFAIAFTTFYKFPIPQISEVEQEINDKTPIGHYGKTSCFRGNRKQLSAEIVNSIYDEYKGVIESEVKLVWSGIGEPPKRIQITMMYTGAVNTEDSSFNVVWSISNPFLGSMEKTYVVSKYVSEVKIKIPDNLYAVSKINVFSNNESNAPNEIVSEKKEVITIHGN